MDEALSLIIARRPYFRLSRAHYLFPFCIEMTILRMIIKQDNEIYQGSNFLLNGRTNIYLSGIFFLSIIQQDDKSGN